MPRFTFEITRNHHVDPEVTTVDLIGLEAVRRETVLTVNEMMSANGETSPMHLVVRVRDELDRPVAECITTLKFFRA